MHVSDVFYAPQIVAAAGRLEREAEELRHRSRLLAAADATCDWDGAGARAFRHRAAAATIALTRAATDLEGAAAALRRHAELVADRVAVEQAEQAAARERAVHDLRVRLVQLGELVGAIR